MSTLAQITAAIDDNIRNKTPLVVKTEHADVDQLITDQLFPTSLELYYNDVSQVSGLPHIAVPSSVPSFYDVQFRIYFEKIGNRVFYSGFISNTGTTKALGTSFGLALAIFATDLYKPEPNRYSSSTLNKIFLNPTVLPNACVTISSSGIILYGLIPQGIIDLYIEGSYKVQD
jgi:hypothetical protein